MESSLLDFKLSIMIDWNKLGWNLLKKMSIRMCLRGCGSCVSSKVCSKAFLYRHWGRWSCKPVKKSIWGLSAWAFRVYSKDSLSLAFLKSSRSIHARNFRSKYIKACSSEFPHWVFTKFGFISRRNLIVAGPFGDFVTCSNAVANGVRPFLSVWDMAPGFFEYRSCRTFSGSALAQAWWNAFCRQGDLDETARWSWLRLKFNEYVPAVPYSLPL